MVNFKKSVGKVTKQSLISKGIADKNILNALMAVPREKFVEESLKELSYSGAPLPIGYNQTISSIYTVALMTQSLRLNENHRILEIGTGSGYQAAVLSMLCMSVFTVERIRELSLRARDTIGKLHIHNITFAIGDGTIGFKEYAPYDRILVTACSPEVPESLISQLGDGGIMVIPLGRGDSQNIFVIEKKNGKVCSNNIAPANFVRLIGKDGFKS